MAHAIGITEELLPTSAIKHTVEFAQEAYSDPTKGKPFKPSMTEDLEAGRPMEVEGIVGSVVKQAKELGFAIPRYAGLPHDLPFLTIFKARDGLCGIETPPTQSHRKEIQFG